MKNKLTFVAVAAILLMIMIGYSCSKKFEHLEGGTSLTAEDQSNAFSCSGLLFKNGLAIRDVGYIINNYNLYKDALTKTNFVVIQVYWKDIDTSAAGNTAGSFDFTKLDSDLSQVSYLNSLSPGYNLKVKLRIYAGLNAPAWVRNGTSYGGGTNGIRYIDYTDMDDDGDSTDYIRLPTPWRPGYLNVFRKFLLGLKNHVALNSLVVDVTGSSMCVATAEPMFLKLGTGNINGGDTVTASDWIAKGYTASQHASSVRYSFFLFDSVWHSMNTSMSMCFSKLQVLKKRPNGTYYIDEVLDSTKNFVDYFYTLNGCRSVLGNNGLRYNVPCDSSGAYHPDEMDVSLYNYLVQKKYPNGTTNDPVCRIYYQSMQAADGLMGHLYETLSTGVEYKADYIELPSYKTLNESCRCVSGCPTSTSPGFVDSLARYDNLLGD